MLFDEENGYTPEYIYGNYFERMVGKKPSGGVKEGKSGGEKEEKVVNLGGLKELIDQGDSSTSRILHRNITASSPRFIYNALFVTLEFDDNCLYIALVLVLCFYHKLL